MHEIKISDYTYVLPPHRIAAHPLAGRDQSMLLIYREGVIKHRTFTDLAAELPLDAALFFNNTKVIPARLLLTKETGAVIEIFLLNPSGEGIPHHDAMEKTQSVSWHCTIGNLKKWNEGTLLERSTNGVWLGARLLNRAGNVVELSWQPSHLRFGEVLGVFGATPLPPYIKRKEEPGDRERYQTVYSKLEGAVAAPTAGLHFTPAVFQSLEEKKITIDFFTLHVSAGTFQPVKSENAIEHDMHPEQIIISRESIENLLQENKIIIAVGTTSMRVLESIYWFGVTLLNDEGAQFSIGKMDAYRFSGQPHPSRQVSIGAVLNHMKLNSLDQITGSTSIYILPGYEFKMVDGLITNFHQPGSTLILLVAAFVGEDWRKIYAEALNNNYRFLSYGDSSLLLPAMKYLQRK